MGREDKATWKANYFTKLIQLLDEYPKCFIVGADNVGSKQMQQIRMSLRGTAVILMGKNTMMRKAIKGNVEVNQAYEKLLPHIKGNVGFVFTKGDLVEVRNKILENKVRAPARAGAIAPCAVIIPAQNTGLGPEKTSFFQALSIPTKISKGTIEIVNDVHILKEGDKVGASDATLLNMLNISPFNYGLVVEQVYDSGTIFEPKILDIKPEDLREKFMEVSTAPRSALSFLRLELDGPSDDHQKSRNFKRRFLLPNLWNNKLAFPNKVANMLFPGWVVEKKLKGVTRLASVCLSINYPTVASAPHTIVNGFKNLLAVAAFTDVEFKEAANVKEYLKDPSKFVAAAAAAAPAPASSAPAPAADKKEEKKKEEEEESDDDMGFGLFG